MRGVCYFILWCGPLWFRPLSTRQAHFTLVSRLQRVSIGANRCDESWTSYHIRNIAGCACAGNVGKVFPRHRLQRKPVISDPNMHHGTCVTHVPWCMSGSLTRGGGKNNPGIPAACANHNFTYLARGPWRQYHNTGNYVNLRQCFIYPFHV